MRILFASLAADGHFNPLTGVAVHLRDAGHDVRWYTGASYAGRLKKLGIPHLPFERALEINAETLPQLYPERARLRGPALIRFDFEHVFVVNAEAYFEDVRDIDHEFPFDVMMADAGFMAARLVRDVMSKHVVGFGLLPILATSPDVPPNFSGLRPARTAAGRLVHRAMGAAMDRMVLAHGRKLYNQVLARHGLAPVTGSVFDEFYGYHDVLFQNGAPGFEYPRRRPSPNLHFAGLLAPHRNGTAPVPVQLDGIAPDRKVILVSQGTIDNHDPGKLIVPALEALLPTGALVIVGTGHRNTEELRRRFPADNAVIEDYVDFESVLERADAFVCNGGYGSTLLSLSKGIPLVAAGVMEGKNDINAHVEHFGVGINLHAEAPSPERIRAAVERVLSEPSFRRRAGEIRDELATYRPLEIIDQYLAMAVERSAPAQSA
jgi:UDP:flavonoid glycosyltransferase YjiC (YdhE family)